MNKNKLAVILALGIITAGGYFGVMSAKADEVRPQDEFITRIAKEFSLNESDVQAVFDAVHEERWEVMQSRKEELLNKAVEDGVLTENQKTQLLEKMREHFGERQKTASWRREEMQTWFAEQGIDETKLQQYLGFGGYGPRGGMMRFEE